MSAIFELEIKYVEDNKSNVVIKVGNNVLESKQALGANELAELQELITFGNQTFKRNDRVKNIATKPACMHGTLPHLIHLDSE